MSNDNFNSEMKDYYNERAPVYDRVYRYAERQTDLRILESIVTEKFSNKRVLEVAAGTGYWTQFISGRAHSVVATDATSTALDQLRRRQLKCPVQTEIIDAYELHNITQTFNAAFAGLWFSHIPIERRSEWFNSLHSRLDTGSKVILIDNSNAQCDRLPLSHTDDQGNTYQDRQTDSGNSYRVLKNFPTEYELTNELAPFGTKPTFLELENFWYFEYEAL
ncbi:MAG: class I SAM-dependent methyltransferase [Gammaproteobacteria bacterium]|nr:class I SAM-dependent methyltransferase [Gammaproteobacteria bacterium]